VILTYKYRLCPTKEQSRKLERIVEIHRQLYNAALEERREAWRRCRVSIRYNDQAAQLKELRTFDSDAAWLNYTSIQQTLLRLDKAFSAFFRRVKAGEKAGYPRFKGRKHFKSVRYVYNDGVRLKNGRLYVQNVGQIRLFQHRPLLDGKIKMVVLKRDGDESWQASLQIEAADIQGCQRKQPAIGIDIGLESLAVLSDGKVIDNPRWFRKAEEKLAQLQQRQARCKPGSRKHKELGRQITRLHQATANKRRDFHHKLADGLVKNDGFIAVEDLNISGLARSRVSKSIADAGWGQFLEILEYKAKEAWVQLVKVPPKDTSQNCSRCGRYVHKTPDVRKHDCPHCGFQVHRDLNAALNILALGQGATLGQRVAVKGS